jgi:hypothetical protein
MTRAPGGVTYLDGDDNHAEPPVRVRVAIAWRDYQDMITYLRDQTDPALPVANLLPHALPVTSVTRHRSLFPAESAAWLRVRPDQIDAFAQALRADAPALVVWSPALDRLHDGHPSHARDDLWPALKTIVRRDYQPLRSFGPLEVWRRKP